MVKTWSSLLAVWLLWAEFAPAQGVYPMPAPAYPQYPPQVMVFGALPGQRWKGEAMFQPPPQAVKPVPAVKAAPVARQHVPAKTQAADVINAVCAPGEGVFADHAVTQASYESPMPISPVVPVTPAVVVPKFYPVQQPKPGPYVVQVVEYEHGENLGCYGFLSLLFWGMKEQNSAPLVTQDQVLVSGDGNLPRDGIAYFGLRGNLGGWLNGVEITGVEVEGFYIVPRRETTTFASDGGVALARPFINAILGIPDQVLLSSAGLQEGSVTVEDELNAFYSIELSMRQRVYVGEYCKFDSLCGLRYLHLDESLDVKTSTQFGAVAPPFSAAFVSTSDEFRTKNHILGPQVGFSSEWQRGRWFANLWGKTAFAVVQSKTIIDGSTNLIGPFFGNQTLTGGVLAVRSNIGGGQREHFTLVPELGLNFGCQVSSLFRLTAGFSMLYISDVYRPGEQMDEVVNPNLIPSLTGGLPGVNTPSRPTFPGARTSFWAQGVSLTMEFRY